MADQEYEPFVVEYQAGPYSGERTVYALDAEDALSQARALIRREMTLPMYYLACRVRRG